MIAAIDLATLDGSNGFRLDGIDTSDFSGRSVASAGDVNGDGFADVIIGAGSADPGGNSSAGESYVVFGKAGGFGAAIDLASLDGSNGFRLDGIDADDISGFAAASAGDVNGDGFADIIIGARGADPGGNSSAGESYVVFGKAGDFAASLSLANLDGSNDFRLDGIDAGDDSGFSVASAGDVNGDSFADIIIGANGADPGGDSYAGESYVVFGKAGDFAASLSLASLDGSNGFRLDGIDAGDDSGFSVASAGDVNGDGVDDVVINAMQADPGGDTDAGESYVVFGKTGNFAASLDLATLDGSNGFRLDGIDPFDMTGISVASAGDVNGDGFDDVIIGSQFVNYGSDSYVGESYVVFGKAGGFAAATDLASLDGSNGFRLSGIDAYDFSGRSVASAGDINGDGLDDLIISAPSADPGGESYVVFGKAGGFAASLSLASLDGSNGFRLDGIDPGDRSGEAVASAGDVNGDGFDDVIVGATNASPGGNSAAGESYVVFGRDFADNNGKVLVGGDGRDNLRGGPLDDLLIGGGGNDTLVGLTGEDTLNGGDGNDTLRGGGGRDLLVGGDGNDDLSGQDANDELAGGAGDDFLSGGNGDDFLSGGAGADRLLGGDGNDLLLSGDGLDILNGNTGDDILAIALAAFDSIDGGLGQDTLRLDGAGEILDTTAILDWKLRGIETVDITGSGDNTLVLDRQEVLNLGSGNTVKVLGNAGDTVAADGGFTSAGQTSQGGITFDVYIAGNATLLVEDEIANQFIS